MSMRHSGWCCQQSSFTSTLHWFVLPVSASSLPRPALCLMICCHPHAAASSTCKCQDARTCDQLPSGQNLHGHVLIVSQNKWHACPGSNHDEEGGGVVWERLWGEVLERWVCDAASLLEARLNFHKAKQHYLKNEQIQSDESANGQQQWWLSAAGRFFFFF